MSFHGAVEVFGRTRISGWAGHEAGGKASPLRFELHFKGHPPLAPTRTVARPEGAGFVFDLPADFHAMAWPDFIAAYEGVLVLAEHVAPPLRWRPLLYKNVLLAHFHETEAEAAASTPRRIARATRLAALTLAEGAAPLLPLWARHHAEIVGAGNLFVLHDGNAADLAAQLPASATLLRLPAGEASARQAPADFARQVRAFQRFLLESYDAVLCTAPDTFICADRTLSAGRSLREVLLALPAPGSIATAWSLWHDIEAESEYDPARPVLAQRRLLAREPALDTALLARLPAEGDAGGGTPHRVAGLHALNLAMFDLEHALAQADDDASAAIVARLRAGNAAFAQAHIRVFDPAAPLTITADWMRAAVTA